MNRYRKIFHHIDIKDVKDRHLEEFVATKLKQEKRIEEEKYITAEGEKLKVDWRKELEEGDLKESDWTLTTSGNKIGATFQHISGTSITVSSGLGGEDVHSTSPVTIDWGFGETEQVAPPTYNQLPLAGIPMPVSAAMPMHRQNTKKKAKEINKQLDSSEKVAAKAKADALMKGRVDEEKKKEKFEKELNEFHVKLGPDKIIELKIEHEKKVDKWYKDREADAKSRANSVLSKARIYGWKGPIKFDALSHGAYQVQGNKLIIIERQSNFLDWDDINSKKKMNIRVVKPYVNPDTGEVSKIKIHKHKEAVNASMVVGSRYSGGLNQKDKFKATTTVTGIDPSDYEDNEIRGLKDIRKPEQDKDLAKYHILKSRVDMPDAYNQDGTLGTEEMQHKAMVKMEMEWTDPEEKSRGLLQKISEIVGADSAKNVFDYYMKSFLDGKLTGTQDLTNMFNSKDIKYMSDYLTSPEIIKLFKRNGKIKQGAMLSVKEMEDFVLNNRKFQAGLGIKNSIGNLDAIGNQGGDSVRIDGNDIVISKAYDFNGLDDILGASNIFAAFGIAIYGASKGILKYLKVDNPNYESSYKGRKLGMYAHVPNDITGGIGYIDMMNALLAKYDGDSPTMRYEVRIPLPASEITPPTPPTPPSTPTTPATPVTPATPRVPIKGKYGGWNPLVGGVPLSPGQLPYWTHPTYEPGKEHDREWWKKINAEPKPYVPPKSKPKSNPNWPIPKPYRHPHDDDDDWLSKIGVTGTDVATLAGTRKKKKKKVTESRVLERIKKDFSYKGKPSPDGFPDTPPPKLKNGWHPEYGKVDNRYNRLDPISAKSMPKTGEASIDRKVEKAKKKKK